MAVSAVTLAAEPRQGSGSRLARRLRRQGKVPAVVYGHKEATVSVSLPGDELMKAVRHGSRVLDLQA